MAFRAEWPMVALRFRSNGGVVLSSIFSLPARLHISVAASSPYVLVLPFLSR